MSKDGDHCVVNVCVCVCVLDVCTRGPPSSILLSLASLCLLCGMASTRATTLTSSSLL